MGRRFATCGEVGDVDVELAQDAGHFVDDARSVVAGDAEHHLMGRLRAPAALRRSSR